MARLIKEQLPLPTPTYDVGMLNQLIRKLQFVLSVDVQTKDEADETEAINFFMGK